MRKIIFLLLLPLLVSSTENKPCLRQISIDHIGVYYDRIIGSIIISTQPIDISNRDYITTRKIILSEEEFSFLEAGIRDFDQIVPDHKQPKEVDYGTFRVEMLDACRPARKRVFNRLQSITFFQYLLKVSDEHDPSLRSKMYEDSGVKNVLIRLAY